MNRGAQAAFNHQVTDLIIVEDLGQATRQAIGVIACKHSALQVELARNKELVKRFISVRYRHLIRCYNTAADALATEALDAKTDNFLLGEERYEELRKLNWIRVRFAD